MTDETNVIAQDGACYRITEQGDLQIFTAGKWQRFEYMLPSRVGAALLADGLRRVREERAKDYAVMESSYAVADERIEALAQDMNGIDSNYRALEERITRVGLTAGQCRDRMCRDTQDLTHHLEAMDNNIARLESRSHRAIDRLDDLEQLGGDYASLDGRIRSQTERIEAVEIERTEGVEVLSDRVSALEASQQDEAGNAKPIEELEIGVRPLREPGDEAGEGAIHLDPNVWRVTVGSVAPETAHAENPKRYCTVEAHRIIRRETAREIAERIKGGYWPSVGFLSYERRSSIAQDVAREFGGESEESTDSRYADESGREYRGGE